MNETRGRSDDGATTATRGGGRHRRRNGRDSNSSNHNGCPTTTSASCDQQHQRRLLPHSPPPLNNGNRGRSGGGGGSRMAHSPPPTTTSTSPAAKGTTTTTTPSTPAHRTNNHQRNNNIIEGTATEVQSSSLSNNNNKPQQQQQLRGRVMLFHGNRQTGQLLLGRIAKLRSKLLRQYQIEIVALDAPFLYIDDSNDNDNEKATGTADSTSASSSSTNHLLTWWHRKENIYVGLADSIELVQKEWNSPSSNVPYIGLMGFSQGARLVHILTSLHHSSSINNHHHDASAPQQQPHFFLPSLQWSIMVAGYDAPWPDNMPKPASSTSTSSLLTIPSLHVWGNRDTLITAKQSQAVTQHYVTATTHIHEGGHHVPMKSIDIRTYINFIVQHTTTTIASPTTDAATTTTASNHHHPNHLPAMTVNGTNIETSTITSHQSMENIMATESPQQNEVDVVKQPQQRNDVLVVEQSDDDDDDDATTTIIPDEEVALQQQEEVEALQAIYPDEFQLVSTSVTSSQDDIVQYEYPIRYSIQLVPDNTTTTITDDDNNSTHGWPPHPIRVSVTYPVTYPDQQPQLQLLYGQHSTDESPVPASHFDACLNAMYEVARNEAGMPCILSCLMAARDYLDTHPLPVENKNNVEQSVASLVSTDDDEPSAEDSATMSTIKQVSDERMQECNLEGLQIAQTILRGSIPVSNNNNLTGDNNNNKLLSTAMVGKGGMWTYTIGLVGKPSAGKSTFFNTATGFARQRQTASSSSSNGHASAADDKTNEASTDAIPLGGAAMAPHPFTTISPNVGFALVPAPVGSCPEDTYTLTDSRLCIGSTHGRDSNGRRLLPVVLKDVAGLVPGAYQGRGRGNQFLNDLCDADVLIHVCDASGMADSEGNIVAVETSSSLDNSGTGGSNDRGNDQNGGSHPLHDMEWIRNELIEWVYTNLTMKWDTVRRKGRIKLAAMFSGYGQPEATTYSILNAVEKFMDQNSNNKPYETRAMDNLDEWDTGDIRRLVSAFLGVRFPIALALNKMDVPSSHSYIQDIQAALPIHGAYTGTALSAKREMMFVRNSIKEALNGSLQQRVPDSTHELQIPRGTWQCLQSAMSLSEPIVVFPVVDHQTYAPLPGLLKYATSDPSLPSPGMVACLQAANGSVPSEWDAESKQYKVLKGLGGSKKVPSTTPKNVVALRDAILMKPGSTVHDVFMTLKRFGALSGEFVRAEAAGEIGMTAKLIPKYDVVTKHTRILKIMTNKRTAWQQS